MIDSKKNDSLKENLTNPAISSDTFVIHTMQDDLEGKAPVNLDNKLTNFAQNSLEIKNSTTEAQSHLNSPFETREPTQKTKFSEQKPTEININPQKIETLSGKNRYKIIFSIIILLIISIIGVGFYYISISNNSLKKTETPTNQVVKEKPTQQNLDISDQVIINPPIDKYSSESPNFLPIETENISVDTFKNQLISISEEIEKLPVSGNYEFIVVDKNNNPISFASFCEQSKLVFSPAIIKKLSQTFSLFFYNDSGNVRLGINIKTLTKDKKSLLEDLATQEKTLPEDIAILFLGLLKEDKNTEFTTSKYDTNSETVRYLNINSDKTLSIDYMVTEDSLIVGTSKETLRKIYIKTKQMKEKNSLSQETADQVSDLK